MHKLLKICAVLAAVVLCGGIGAAVRAADLLSTHPTHYDKHLGGGPPSGSALGRKTKQARPGSRILVRDEGRLQERWVLSPDLSKACRQRNFRQKRDNFFIGQVNGVTYGAAVGGHGSLVDRAKLAENQVVYLFRGQGTTDCRVYHRTK
ncbi:hypothetical protein [Pelagibius sp.]|uniref:hypothetical protein n=1 Tax=Pelagibius sp. TaxID=1931238 RepID=UPI002603BD5C|nr:hypothetical protein [Pelagibius sp.]